MLTPVEVKALPGHKLWLRYADGVEGDVDLSGLVGKGVFRLWDAPGSFDKVAIGQSGEITGGDEVDLCPDALYMRITRKSPEEVFPRLREADVHA